MSEALRDTPRVNAETRRRVCVAAQAAGYRKNPLASVLMSEMRRSRAGVLLGVIAIVDLDGPESRPPSQAYYHRELSKGAIDRAAELGFRAEVFIVGHGGMTTRRLDTILQSRGIHAVFFLPVSDNPDVTPLDWTRYAGVYTDCVIEHPALHSICPNHFRAMLMALRQLRALGYKRPGLVLQRHHDERLLHLWEAAHWAYQTHIGTPRVKIPVHLPGDIGQKGFTKWFKKHNPDVVLCHRAEVMGWMREAGARIPRTHGYCCLNTMMNPDVPCAGLDLQPRLLGARGIELLIAQLHRNEYGIPVQPSTTTIPARWIDGPTLRAMGRPVP
ncbi:LacI family transcriptional regulator [Termitidicoccus mucosus]|uniref:LacI family transcriptional regulator n=1 Tax=Termitidicoccus mucosus TaxID=1184151 RepID=A0A178IIP3_9BACT|nr:LacI family transcriptional regulator [Opitutaceae bacterium TSB47]